MPRSPAVVPAAALAVALSLALPSGAAIAQTAEPAFSAGVSPTKAGSKRKPVSATVRVAVDVPAARRKTPTRMTVRMPANVRLSGSGFPVCPAAAIAAAGEGACPAGSRVGSAVVTGALSTPSPTPATWVARVYVASAGTLSIAFRGITTVPVEAAITGGRRRLRVDFPPEVRSPLEGLSTYVTGISLTFGGTRTTGSGRKKKLFRLATLNGCPKDRTHDLAAEVAYARNDAGSGGAADRLLASARCRR
jgi:hypothetical protein